MSNPRDHNQSDQQQMKDITSSKTLEGGKNADLGQTQEEERQAKRRQNDEGNNGSPTKTKKKGSSKKGVDSDSQRMTSSMLGPNTGNELDVSSQRKNSVNGILKTSNVEGKRAGPYKKSQFKVDKRTKIAFREELQDVKIVENWKNYNSEDYQQTSCHCNTF